MKHKKKIFWEFLLKPTQDKGVVLAVFPLARHLSSDGCLVLICPIPWMDCWRYRFVLFFLTTGGGITVPLTLALAASLLGLAPAARLLHFFVVICRRCAFFPPVVSLFKETLTHWLLFTFYLLLLSRFPDATSKWYHMHTCKRLMPTVMAILY